jgi:hypothetical protein
MSGRDENFRAGQRVRGKVEGEYVRGVERTRDNPDEVVELINFAVGAGGLADDPERIGIRFILPTGRQYIAKMSFLNALDLAGAIRQTVQVASGIEDAGDGSVGPSEGPDEVQR